MPLPTQTASSLLEKKIQKTQQTPQSNNFWKTIINNRPALGYLSKENEYESIILDGDTTMAANGYTIGMVDELCEDISVPKAYFLKKGDLPFVDYTLF